MLVQAYGMTQNHFAVTRHALVGGSATLHIMDIYPMQGPLAKIKIPIDYLIQRVERLLTGFANEISATQWYPATFDRRFFFALCCLGKIPGGAPFSQLHKSGNGSRVDRP